MSTVIEIPPENLPDWMRQARRGIDWGMLLILAFSLTIAMPFITQKDLPHSNASENYVYRAADYAAALLEGRLYPRWSANAFGGYGAPIPHYFPPAPGYTAATIQVLFTADAVLAVRIVYVLALSLAGTMVYAFVTRRAGAAAGLLSGMLYVYSPYIGLTAPHILGDLSGVMTFALMPTLLWSVDRLIVRNRPLDILLIALTTSALYLTSFRAAIISTLLAAILVTWHRNAINRRIPWPMGLIGYLLGIGIASFYWIPAVLERDAIRWQAAFIQPNLSLKILDLVTPLRQVDVGKLVQSPQLTLGIAIIGFAIAGGVSIVRFRALTQFQALFLTTGLGISALAVLIFPHEIWLLGAITLCFSIGGSSVIQWRKIIPKQARRLFLPILLILIWIISSPVWLPPPVLESFGSTDDTTQVQYEQQGYGIAVIPPDKPIPTTLVEGLSSNRFLLDGYQAETINKITPGQLTVNAQAGLLDHNSHSDLFQVRTSTPITLDMLTAYFPGWSANIGNRPVPVTRNPETGLMRVDVPALSSGEMFIVLSETDIRTGAWIISWSMLMIVLVITWGRLRQHQYTFEDLEQLSYKEARLISVVLASVALIIFLFNNPNLPLSLRVKPGYELQNSTFIQNRTDSGLNLLAFRLNKNQYQAGDTIDLTLYWQAQRSLAEDYKVSIQLVNNQDSSVWSPTALRNPGNYPTRRWKSGLYVSDEYHLGLSPNMKPGNYQINVSVVRCNPDCILDSQVTFFNINGEILGTNLTLPTLINVSS